MACRENQADALNMNMAGLEQLANHLINDVGCTALYDFDKSIRNMTPLNTFTLKMDYISRKNGPKEEPADVFEANKALIDAVGNNRFSVKF